MSSKEKILKEIRKNNLAKDMGLPAYINFGIKFENPYKTFCEMIQSVGGDAICIKEESLYDTIKKLYPNENNIASNLEELKEKFLDTNLENDPHNLNTVDLAIVKGEFAVAENGAIWVSNKKNRHRALYFIAQNIILVVKKDDIVNNMHEAYGKIDFDDLTYGVFVSGPSKTADIEQSLVIGAHGPKSGYVIFLE
ncbi:hypothetical protein CRV08_07205 [Halarcobacter ebronensis]|uniref:LUD domain-containing protein n=1 Tax=Halarcobacter ebronensis TaxID=1462615 RepID=A0A4Q0YDP7_9BACT|nr:LUD domain-containing protein [Halarcobacter ebronensis]RXJ68606.1 hypothetical protein CRV08_07205 [Halarcobacter ebronensis]